MPRFTSEHLDYLASLNKSRPASPSARKRWRVQRPDGSIVQFFGPRNMSLEAIDKSAELQSQVDQRRQAEKKFELADKLFPQTNEGVGKLAAGFAEFMNTPLLPEVKSGEEMFAERPTDELDRFGDKFVVSPSGGGFDLPGGMRLDARALEGMARDTYNNVVAPFSSPTGLLSLAVPGGMLSKAARPSAALATKALPGIMSGAAAPGAAMDVNQAIQDPTLTNKATAASSVGNVLLGGALSQRMMQPRPAPPTQPPPALTGPIQPVLTPGQQPALPPAGGIGGPRGLIGPGEIPQRPFNPDPNAPIPGYPRPTDVNYPGFGQPAVSPVTATAMEGQVIRPGPLPPALAERFTQGRERGLNPDMGKAEYRAYLNNLQRSQEPLPEMPSIRRSKTERQVDYPLREEPKPEPFTPKQQPKPGEALEGFDNVTYEGEGFGADLYKYGGKEGNNFSVKKGASNQEFLDAYYKARKGYESRITNEQAKTAQPEVPREELKFEPQVEEKPTVGKALEEKEGAYRGEEFDFPDELPQTRAQEMPLKRAEGTVAEGEILPELPITMGDRVIERNPEPGQLPYRIRQGDKILSKGLKPETLIAAERKRLARETELEAVLRDIDEKYADEPDVPDVDDIPEGFQEEVMPPRVVEREVRPSRTVEREPKKKEAGFPLAEKRPGERGSIRLFTEEGEEPLKSNLRLALSPSQFKGEIQPTSELFRILNKGGISKEELRISKLQDFIVKNPRKFSVSDLQKHLDANQRVVQETTFKGLSPDERNLKDSLRRQIISLDRQMDQLVGMKTGKGVYVPFRGAEYTEGFKKYLQEQGTGDESVDAIMYTREVDPKFRELEKQSQAAQEQYDALGERAHPRFTSYTEQGPRTQEVERTHAIQETTEHLRLTQKEQRELNALSNIERKLTPNEVQRMIDLTEKNERYLDAKGSYLDKATRYEVPEVHAYGERRADVNRIGQTRFDQRELSSGKQTTHLNELQSDWMTRGRKKGFFSREDVQKLEDIKDELRQPGINPKRRVELFTQREQLRNKMKEGVSEPPILSKEWIDMSMKRMLVEAAENDSGYLTWSKGKTVADRYNLRHYIEKLRWGKDRDEIVLIGSDRSGEDLVRKIIKTSQLEDFVGAERAKKILDSDEEFGHFEGADLELGGEWAINQYDKKMVNYMNDLAKKNNWGVQVETKVLAKSTGETGFRTGGGGEVWALKITPEMQMQLLRKGLPTSGEKFAPSGRIVERRPGERGSITLFPKKKSVEGISDVAKKRQDIMTPITDVIAGLGPAGKQIARLMTRGRLVGEYYAGQWEQRAKDVLEGISDEEFGHVTKEGKVLRGNVIDVLEGNAQPRNEKIRQAAAELRQLLDETGTKAEQSGMSLRVGDKNVPFEKRANYFPHLYTEQFWNRIKKDNQFREKILERIVKQNPGMTLDSAFKLLGRARQFGERLIDPQHERVFNLPGWERSKGALFKHLHDMGRQIGSAEELGPKDIAGSKLDTLIKKTKDPDYAYELLKRAMKRDEPPQIRDVKLANKITTAASWAYLSRAAIGNMAQLTRVPTHASFTSAAKSFASYLRDRKGFYRDSLNSGAIVEIGAKGLMEEFGSKSRAYKTYGIEQSEKFLRSIASAAGRSEAEAAFRALKKDPGNKHARVQLTDLLQENADNVLKQDKLSDKQSATAGGRMAELTQGRAEAMDLPKNWSGSPYANLYFLYKKYALQDTRNMWKAIQKNPAKAIATIAVLNQAAGEVVGDIKEALKGIGEGLVTGDLRGKAMERIEKRGEYLNKDNPEVGRFFDNYLQSWTFGVLSDALQNVKRGEFAGTVGEMAGDIATTAISTGTKIVEGKESPLKPAAKTATGMIPVLGPGIREGLFPKEEAPKRRRAPARRVVRRSSQRRAYSP